MTTIKINVKYPVVFERSIIRELDIETFEYELKDYIEEFGYTDTLTKDQLILSIKSLAYQIQDYYGEEIYSEDDDINMIDEFNTDIKLLNLNELVDYFSYLINE